jgi:cytochrome c-type biogenesis protein CcmF
VHAFATDPARGVFILGFLTFVVGGSLTLFALRAHRVGGGGGFEPVSREAMLLGNNVLLLAAAGSVLLGTLYPLVLDALGLGKISVGPPYFEAVFAPLMAPLVFLMGVGPLARWKQASPPDLWARLKWALAIAVAAALLLPVIAGKWSAYTSLGFGLAAWIAAATAAGVRERLRTAQGGWRARLAQQPRAWWGMTAAHLGVAVFIVGVTVVKSFETERDVRVAPGDAVAAGGHSFRFVGVTEGPGPNYRATRGTVEVSRGGKVVRTLHPEKRVYLAQSQMPMTEAAIASGLFGDLYVSLGEPVGDGAWTLRVYHKPFVTWIWGGCLLMALGGFLALSDRRYRARATRAVLAPGAATAS